MGAEYAFASRQACARRSCADSVFRPPARRNLCLAFDKASCSLLDALRGGHPGFKDAGTGAMERVACQLLKGLAHVHLTGIAHMDIKPDNISLNLERHATSPCVCIADFGSAVPLDPRCRPRGLTGLDPLSVLPNQARMTTLLYRAPEVLYGYEKFR